MDLISKGIMMKKETLEIGIKLSDEIENITRDKSKVIQRVKEALCTANSFSAIEFMDVIDMAASKFDHKINALQKEFDNL